MTMKQEPEQEERYGEKVWVNPTTEEIRREECLCWNCDNLKIGEPDNCVKAEKLYQVCKSENLAVILTWCPIWKPKKMRRFKIIEPVMLGFLTPQEQYDVILDPGDKNILESDG